MGVGDPLEASYGINAPLPAGKWHLVGDGVVLSAVDMQFDVLLRSGGMDKVIVSFMHHFDVPADSSQVVPFDGDAEGPEVTASVGDLLVLRMTAQNAAKPGPAFVPNSDGSYANGRIPSLTLP